MPISTDLIKAVAAFDRLMELQNPDLIRYWHPPEQLRAEYISLAETVVYALDALRDLEAKSLHHNAEVESKLPRAAISALRKRIRPKEESISDALDHLDPDNKMLRELMVFQTRPAGRGGSVRSTFEQGVEQVQQLIERNPDSDYGWLHPDLAQEVLHSKLIGFEPDAWLDRIADLEPIRTAIDGPGLPPDIRLRLRELYQVYSFGCWFAALSAVRATLEYALHGNVTRLAIQLAPPKQQSRSPGLYQLIEAFAKRFPELGPPMHRLRELGNLSLHPLAAGNAVPPAAQRGLRAAEAITLLQQTLEDLYAK